MVSYFREDDSFFRPTEPLHCPLLGEAVPISIYTDADELHSDQLRAISKFLLIPAERRIPLLAPLFADYREVFEAVGEAPVINVPSDAWANVRWTQIIVPRQGSDGRRFVCVQGEPAWEVEHGVEMWFCNEKLIRLDRASGAFLSSCYFEWSES